MVLVSSEIPPCPENSSRKKWKTYFFNEDQKVESAIRLLSENRQFEMKEYGGVVLIDLISFFVKSNSKSYSKSIRTQLKWIGRLFSTFSSKTAV